jgi:hypothetical protein
MIKVVGLLVFLYIVCGVFGFAHYVLWDVLGDGSVPAGQERDKDEVLSELRTAGYSPVFEGHVRRQPLKNVRTKVFTGCERYSVIASPGLSDGNEVIRTYYYFADSLVEISGHRWR